MHALTVLHRLLCGRCPHIEAADGDALEYDVEDGSGEVSVRKADQTHGAFAPHHDPSVFGNRERSGREYSVNRFYTACYTTAVKHAASRARQPSQALTTSGDIMIRFRKAIAAILMTVAASTFASQAYPSKPVRLVVPFPPGGSVDALARNLQQSLQNSLGQPIIIDNKGGAAGSIGSNDVAKSAPDGYTMLMVFDTHATNPHLIQKLPFDSFKDFTPVTLIATTPLVLVTHPSLKVKNLNDFLSMAKKSPGTINYGSIGNGSSGHLAGELLKRETGVDIQHIPFKGGGPAVQALMGGHVQAMFTTITLTSAHVKAGRLNAVAILNKKRSPSATDVATVEEGGVKGVNVSAWFGLLAPAGTPDVVVQKWREALAKATADPAIKAKLDAMALDIVLNKPEEFGAFLRQESQRWSKVIQDAKITVD